MKHIIYNNGLHDKALFVSDELKNALSIKVGTAYSEGIIPAQCFIKENDVGGYYSFLVKSLAQETLLKTSIHEVISWRKKLSLLEVGDNTMLTYNENTKPLDAFFRVQGKRSKLAINTFTMFFMEYYERYNLGLNQTLININGEQVKPRIVISKDKLCIEYSNLTAHEIISLLFVPDYKVGILTPLSVEEYHDSICLLLIEPTKEWLEIAISEVANIKSSTYDIYLKSVSNAMFKRN